MSTCLTFDVKQLNNGKISQKKKTKIEKNDWKEILWNHKDGKKIENIERKIERGEKRKREMKRKDREKKMKDRDK